MEQDRTKFIGGSDAAAVLGLSRWRTALQVWAEKTGQVEAEDISHKMPVRLGKKLEQTVAELFTEETGLKVEEGFIDYHADYDFIEAEIDRMVVGENAHLECKTVTPWMADEWADNAIPVEYEIQVRHQLAVTHHDHAYIAVVIGNQDFQWRKIERNKKVEAELIKKEVAFWNDFVLTKEMPFIITNRDSDVLYQLYPGVDDSEIELDDKADRIIELLRSLKAEAMSIDAHIERNKNILKALLKDNIIGTSPLHRVSWKPQSKKNVDREKLKENHPEIYLDCLKETKYRVLRYKEKKGD